jgi:death-on-curing protein
MNHPFIDGNKRVAFFATDAFLRLNGWRMKVDPDEAHKTLIALLQQGDCDFDHLLPFIRQSLTKLV